MALIPPTGMGLLRSATEVAAVAASADLEHEIMVLANVINSAANTGLYQAAYNKPISAAARQQLEDAGYTIITNNNAAVADSNFVIRWSA